MTQRDLADTSNAPALEPPATERIYRHILEIQTGNHKALYLLRTLAQQAGRSVLHVRHKFKEAINHYRDHALPSSNRASSAVNTAKLQLD